MDSRFRVTFQNWLVQQEDDLDELQRALDNPATPDAELHALVAKAVSHFQQYSDRRRFLALEDAPALFCPHWCSTFETSFLWIGGCRPSLFFRLVDAPHHQQPADDDSMWSMPQGGGVTLEQFMGGAAAAAAADPIGRLRRAVALEEEQLDLKMKKLQEGLAEKPMITVATRGGPASGGQTSNGNVDDEVREVMEDYSDGLMGILEEADTLRVKTLRRLAMELLKPREAAEFLRTGKKLYLSVHEWGKTRDRERGRKC